MNSEETQSDKSLALLTWFEVNKKRVLYAAVGILVVGCGMYVADHLAQQKEFDATQALVDIVKIDATGKPLAVPAADYFGVAEKYSGTHAAERAMLQGAGALFTEKNYAEAKSKFEAFVAKYPNSPFLANAEYGKAACLDGMNQVDPALSAYQQIVTRFSGESVANQSKIAMAVIYEGKKQADLAYKLYEEILKDQRAFFWRPEVERLLGHLLMEYPSLRENAAPKPAMTPVAPGPAAPKMEARPGTQPAPKMTVTPAPAPKK